MESVSTFFKEENDILYMVGERRGVEKGMEKGVEKGKIIEVKNLLTKTNFSLEEIAEIAEVAVSFVEKVKASLYNSAK
jgi:predicted transposase YdaD